MHSQQRTRDGLEPVGRDQALAPAFRPRPLVRERKRRCLEDFRLAKVADLPFAAVLAFGAYARRAVEQDIVGLDVSVQHLPDSTGQRESEQRGRGEKERERKRERERDRQR